MTQSWGVDSGEGGAEGGVDFGGGAGLASGGEDFETKAMVLALAHGGEHARRILFEVHLVRRQGKFAVEQGAQFVRRARPVVDAAHEEVDVPGVVLDVIDDLGLVGGDTDQDSGLADMLRELANLIHLCER